MKNKIIANENDRVGLVFYNIVKFTICQEKIDEIQSKAPARKPITAAAPI